MNLQADEIERLTAEVRRGKKYRYISPSLVAHIGQKEIEKRGSFKEAVKSTRNKLHQIGGLYFERNVDYQQAWEALVDAKVKGDSALRDQAQQVMGYHTSTRERLPILTKFYNQLMEKLPPPRVILDVACGLNPLALPWMGLPSNSKYYAYDIYADLVEFVDGVIDLFDYSGAAHVRDVVHDPPTQSADLAMVLKSLPCLEQIEKGVARNLLVELKARHVVVSYPVQGVGGRGKGMVVNYQEQFEGIISGLPWSVKRLAFESELVFLIDKG
jgi:16S rRNA (guanine(1405)-N(7))-methyltransferase